MRRWCVLLVVFALSAVAGCAAPAAQFASGSPTSSASPSVAIVPVAQLRDNVYDLLFDPARDAIWFSEQEDPPGLSTLDEYQIASHQLVRVPLGPAESNTYLSKAVMTSDGAVWLSEAYRIARYDPTAKQVAYVDLPLAAEGALQGAYDPNASTPGTWVSAIAADRTGILVARKNVPYLTQVASDMTTTGTIALKPEFAGATALAVDNHGDIYVGQGLLGGKGVELLSPGGSTVLVPGTAERLLAVGGQVRAEGGTLDGQVLADSQGPASVTPANDAPPPDSLSVPDPSGGVYHYDASAGTLALYGQDGTVRWTTLLDGALDMVADQSGGLWVSRANAFQLLSIQLTTATSSPSNLNGSPSSIGSQLVLSVAQALQSMPANSTPFLVTGWLGVDHSGCINRTGPYGNLVPECGYYYIANEPPNQFARPSQLPLAVLDNSTSVDLQRYIGRAVVLRLHVNDPMAAACPSAVAVACRAAAVVDGIPWSASASN
jgi:hypothetical protein